MKNLIIGFVLVLLFTCWVNGYNYPPSPWKAGIADIKEGKLGVKRDEGLIPEMKITDGYRANSVMTHINDRNSDRDVDFPAMGNN